MRYRFGDLELDTTSHRVSRDGVALKVWPKVFDVLRYLIDNRGRLVTKQELLDTLWSDSHVDEVAVPWTISHARRLIGQRGGDKTPIETVHGRGYRFNAVVEELPDLPKPQSLPPPSGAVVQATSTEEANDTPSAPFVGRQRAMERLDQHVREATLGRGALVVLSGPAGIGKTRCMDEVARRALAQGVSVYAGRCVEDGGAPVYWPWIQLVRQCVAREASLRERGQALLDRLRHSGHALDAKDEGGSAEETSFWWLDGVSNLLLEAAQTQPLLLLLDDLHWADAASIDLLAFVAPELRRARVLVVASQRDVSAGQPTRALKRLSRHVEPIALGELSVDDVAAYVRTLTGIEQLDSSLCEAIHRASAGNPLFVEHTLRSLLLQHGPQGLRTLSALAVEPPHVARDVLGATLNVLDDEARVLLAQASVLGERFDVATLHALSGGDVEELLAKLEAARAARFIVAEEPVAYRFCHALLRAVLYEALPADERVTLHRRAAQVLERAPSSHLAEIAHHYVASLPLGDAARVTSAALHAARAAARLQAFDDALRCCEWAQQAQARDAEASPRARADLLLFTAQMQLNAGQDDPARQTLEQLAAIARPHGYYDLLVRGARVVRHTHMMGSMEDPTVRAWLEEALDHAPPGANELRISALSQLSWTPPYALDMAQSKALSGEAVELARDLGDERVLLRALNARLHALSGPDDIDALLQTADEILTHKLEGYGWASAAALGARYTANMHRGEMAAADRACEALGRVAQAGQWPAAIWYHERLLTQRALQRGELQATTHALVTLRERGRRLRVGYAQMLVDLLQAVLDIERDGVTALRERLAPSALQAQLSLAPINLRPTLGRLMLALGDRVGAQGVLDDLARDRCALLPRDTGYLHALCSLARLAVALDDRPHAEQLDALLQPYARFNTPTVVQLCEGAVAHVLAELASYLGHAHAQVETHYAQALALHETWGLRPQWARTAVAYGSWLCGRPDAQRKQRGEALLQAALSAAHAMGMRALAAQITALQTTPGASD